MSSNDLLTGHFRVETLEQPYRLQVWYGFGSEPEEGPVELDEREAVELAELFERAARLVSEARVRGERPQAAAQRTPPIMTDPFALRGTAAAEEAEDDDE